MKLWRCTASKVKPGTPTGQTRIEYDDRGNPLCVTSPDDWSAVRDEKGETDQPIRFQGQQLDEESGLHYNWHRYYDPSIGRYVTQDPIGLATRAEINAALQTLRTSYASDFAKAPASVTPVPMGENGLGMTDWGNNVSLNSDRFGSGTDCVKSGDEYQFLQTLAHEMLHVNESIPRRLLSNSFRMGNPLGCYHRQLDDKADEMITQKTIDKYIKARSSNKGCTCR